MVRRGHEHEVDGHPNPAAVVAVAGPLPFAVVEQVCTADAIAASEAAAEIVLDSSPSGLVQLAGTAPVVANSEAIRLIALVADVLLSCDGFNTTPEQALALAELMQRSGRYKFEIIRDAARACLLQGRPEVASSFTRYGLQHDQANIELLHLQSMALESVGRHGAATGIDSQKAGLSDPAWLGRWASNLFLSTRRNVEPRLPPSVDDDQHELKANLAWIQALEGDVATVARTVSQIIDDPRSSSQAVVWACVAGAFPAALDGRTRIARAMIDHAKSLLVEVRDELSPFAELQIGLVGSLSEIRLGNLADEAAAAEANAVGASAAFFESIWSFFAGIAHRELGNFEAALGHFETGFRTVDTDPFGFSSWAQSEASVCAAMIGDDVERFLDPPDPAQGHGLFRSCLYRNESWRCAATGDHRAAIDASQAAAAVALELGQNVHLALALLDMARFGESRRAVTMLTQLTESEAPIIVDLANAVVALDGVDDDSLIDAAALLRRWGMHLQVDELLWSTRHRALRAGNLWLAARLHMVSDPTLRPTPIFRRYGPAPQQLTDREREVARLCGLGATSREIGVTLGNSTRTVDNLLGRVYRKCGFDNRAALRRWYQRLDVDQRPRPVGTSQPLESQRQSVK